MPAYIEKEGTEMVGRGKPPRLKGHWACWVVMIIVETGSGMDYDTYNEEYSGVEWCSKKNALAELKEALAAGNTAFLECREVTPLC